jgi:PPM family protein phosphatase
MTEKPRGKLQTVAAGLTDVGRQRRHNEDHILVREDFGLFVVADGMGGHNAGNVASALVTKSVDNFFIATEEGPLPPPKADEIEISDGARRLGAAVRKANRDVYEISSTHQQHHGMGSTVVAIYIPPGSDDVHIAHVGDSRCYRVRDGQIKQLTRDHSLINDALDIKPDLTDADLARLPKNIITRALGMKDVVKVDVRTEKIQPGDIFLLCSDGLSGMVNDADLSDVLGMTEQVADTCEVLVAMANDAGGTDNISAVVVRVVELERAAISLPPSRTPSMPPRGLGPPMLEIVSEDEEEDVFSDHPSGRLQSVVGEPIQSEGETSSELLIAEDHDIAELAEMLDEEGALSLDGGAYGEGELRESHTIPFDLPPALCKRCRADLLIGTRFCVECGTPMQLSSPTTT